jgi:hypothetical protein
MEWRLWYTQMQPVLISETVKLATKYLSVLEALSTEGLFNLDFFTAYMGK